MNILILSGSPRKGGNTDLLVESFANGAYIEEGSMYLYQNNGTIQGAMAVTMYQDENYHAIEWSQHVDDIQVAVIHILASNTPAHRLYEHLGFEYRGKQHLFAENTSWTDFFFFDYNEFIS